MKEYLKEKIFIITSILLTNLAIILVSVFLYKSAYEPVVYPILLQIILLSIYFINDYSKYKNKKEVIENIKKEGYLEDLSIEEAFNQIENKILDLVKIENSRNKNIIEESKIETKNIHDYYSMWVHQIKTPISALSFLIENTQDENKKKLEIELFKIEQYVELVLSYIRLDKGQSDLLAEKVDLKKETNALLKKYSSLIFAKNISIDYGQLNLITISDKKWLSFIIEQILSNAIKYSKDKTRIKIYQEENSLVIEDQGIGISSDNLPRIFDQGFTGFNGRAGQKSSGLGLYLAKKAADKISCHLEISSQVGVGTKVRIKFQEENVV
ncbi:MAG: sensor histidine kinase [Gemella sp.]|nr:sensor histidine kinase [Gemella sp.]